TSSQSWVVGITIAIVASLESLLSVEATDNLDPHKRVTDTNRELIAQGTGNVVSGLIGGLPVTQVIIRSTVNIQSGGKTKASAVIHGVFLLICVAVIPHVLNIIPLAVLASILLVVGFKLVNPDSIKDIYRKGMGQFLPFAFTVVGVVMTDLLIGILMGLSVSIVIILRRSLQNSHFLNMENHEGNNHIKMTLAEEVYFMNKGAILSELNKVPENSQLTIDMSRSVSIDYDVLEIINNFKETAKSKNISLTVIEGASNQKREGKKVEKKFVEETA
ncbi:MAG TPA: solute carrier family 23 protein, partial [Cyclobacteriaceae bacterium]|nr:solute carrier family 23 protein [Cyclobacteriaceae bacterium]